jgi:hypothetical protein
MFRATTSPVPAKAVPPLRFQAKQEVPRIAGGRPALTDRSLSSALLYVAQDMDSRSYPFAGVVRRARRARRS